MLFTHTHTHTSLCTSVDPLLCSSLCLPFKSTRTNRQVKFQLLSDPESSVLTCINGLCAGYLSVINWKKIIFEKRWKVVERKHSLSGTLRRSVRRHRLHWRRQRGHNTSDILLRRTALCGICLGTVSSVCVARGMCVCVCVCRGGSSGRLPEVLRKWERTSAAVLVCPVLTAVCLFLLRRISLPIR